MVRKILFILTLANLVAACGRNLPTGESADHTDAIRAFYVGLAALDVGDDRRAIEELTKSTKLAAGEPASWNNLGVTQLRQRDFAASKTSLGRAASLAERDTTIRQNVATLALQTGDETAAIAELERIIKDEPSNMTAVFQLADLRERSTNVAEALTLYRRIAASLPQNLAAKLEAARLDARLGNAADLNSTLAAIDALNPQFSDEAHEQLASLRSSAARNDLPSAATSVSFLRNVLLREAWFRDALAEFKPSDTVIGRPIHRPMLLAVPEFRPAAPDVELSFTATNAGTETSTFAKLFYFDGSASPAIIQGRGQHISIGDERIDATATKARQIAAFDFDYDYRNDLAIADETGFKLFQRGVEGRFVDVTTATKLSPQTLNGKYEGVWPLDIEHDGDLDLILAPVTGDPVVLQNNSDGGFSTLSPFKSVADVRDFAYADIDEDGDADAIFLTGDGHLRIFANARGASFTERKAPELSGVSAFAIGDVSGDAKLDIIAFNGKLNRLTDVGSGTDWLSGSIEIDTGRAACRDQSPCSLFIGDLDNNGANDIVASGGGRTEIYSPTQDGRSLTLGRGVDTQIDGLADTNGDGRLDLVGVAADGMPAVMANQSAKNYGWQIFRPRSGKAEGDQRVNTFGIGGEMEIRSGTQTQKQLVTAPVVHFGLGEATATDVLRIIWNNGFVQAEFDLERNQAVAAEQRLKGSCPHMFAWNGEKFALVKDAPPWSPALGLKINAQDTFGILQTEEWFKIPGDLMRPLNGAYELRITGEYWESFYLDNYKLLVVDHPASTEVHTDERFSVPPPPLEVFSFEGTVPFTSVIDHNGRDVVEIVRSVDESYLDGIKRGKFQGVAENHWAEFELPANAPQDRPLTLIADGWLYPTDASINVQLGQSSFTPPRSLSLEIPDGNGGWKTAKENLGFPAGKMKTVLIDLPAGERQFRLRTNMEIYWDRLAWAAKQTKPATDPRVIDIGTAELRYRGFSVIEKPNASSPERPVYDKILTTGQRWRDLEGYYTRFGDVKELLSAPEGRMILMNAGDELILRFPAQDEPAAGMKRDFFIVGNGWIKDGDLNSVFSKTLLPLPRRDTNDYTTPPRRLEDDPVFQKYPADWHNFHTRYVSADGFRRRVRQPQ